MADATQNLINSLNTAKSKLSNLDPNMEIGVDLSGFQDVGKNTPTPSNVTPEINANDVGREGFQFPQSDASSNDIMASLQALVNNQPEADDSAITALENTLMETSSQLGERPVETLEAERDAGIPELQKQRSDIRTQLSQLQASLTQGLVDEEGRIVPMGVITGRQNQIQRQALAKSQSLLAIDQALEGNITTAQNTIDRQMNIKYGALENQLDTIKTALTINTDRFNRKEKKLAEQRSLQISLLQSELQNRRDVEKTAFNNILEATQLGMSPAKAQAYMTGIQEGTIDPYDALAETAYITGETKRLALYTARSQYNQMQQALNNPTTLDAKTREAIGKMDETKKSNSLINLNANLAELKSLIDEYGAVNIIDAEAKGKIESLKANIKLSIADAFGQGAIQAGDDKLYDEIVGSGVRTEVALNAINTAISTNNNRIKSNIDFVENIYPNAMEFGTFKTYFEDEELSNYVVEALPKEDSINPLSEQSSNPFTNFWSGIKAGATE